MFCFMENYDGKGLGYVNIDNKFLLQTLLIMDRKFNKNVIIDQIVFQYDIIGINKMRYLVNVPSQSLSKTSPQNLLVSCR